MGKKLWNKDYILLLQGNAVSTLGDLMYSVAIGFWVYEQTGSSGLMGLMSSVSMFVTMFLSPFCGSIVDKCDRKWLIVAIDTIQGILLLTVGILAYMNALSVTVVLLGALIASFCGVFYSPAISTIMLDIIPRDDMIRGQSIHSGINSFINLMGSAFSGAMVAIFGVPLIVVLNGVSNLYAALSELLVQVPRTVHQGDRVSVRGILADSVEAVKTIFRDRFLVLFVPCALILNLLAAGPLALMMPFCLEKGYGVDLYGYVIFVYMGGYCLCTMLLGAVKLSPKARFWVLALGFSCSTPFYIFGYLTENYILLCVATFCACFLNCAGNTVFNAALMLALPEDNRSTILGFIQSASVGGTALSTVIYGVLGDVFPLYLVFAVGTAISLIPMLYMCFHPNTRQFVLEHCE